jgi:hypothetical protein
MEEQAEGMAEIFGTDTQLKELYDSLEQEDKAKNEEYERLKDEMSKINLYLDTFGIPRKIGNKHLSILERLSIAMEKAA